MSDTPQKNTPNTSNDQSNPPQNRRKGDRRKNRNGTPPPGTVIDRRLGLDPRAQNSPTSDIPASEQPSTNNGKLVSSKKSGSAPTSDPQATGLERKRGRGRRLSEFTKSAEEGEMTTEQFLFLMAIDAFKKGNDRMFPTWTDVLEVIRLLGYRKTQPSDLNLTNADDWTEAPNTPANVRPDRWAERFTTPAAAAASPTKPTGPQSESELTDQALEAFEAAFGSDDDQPFDLTEDFSDLDEYNEAA